MHFASSGPRYVLPLTQAPTEAHVQAWQTRPVGATRASAPAPVASEPADDTYVTDVDVEERRARAPAPRPTQRPAARPAERPRAPPASSLASSRTRAPRGQSTAPSSSTTTRARVPPAVLKRRTVRCRPLYRPLRMISSIPCPLSTARAIPCVPIPYRRSSAFLCSTLSSRSSRLAKRESEVRTLS